MKKLSTFKIDVPIYNATVVFRLGNILDLPKDLQKSYNIDIEEDDKSLKGLGGITLNLEYEYGVNNTFVVAIDNFWNYALSYTLPLVHHELIHFGNMLIGNRGMKSSDKDDENLAYISQYVFDKFLCKICIDNLKDLTEKENEHN